MPSPTPSWSLYHHQPPGTRTLNAIRPEPAPDAAAERTARHLRLCQELIDLGMTLARAAAARAADDIAAPPPTTPIPGSSAAALTHAEDMARNRAPDYGRLFTHLSRAIRQTMLLEAHIAEGATRTSHRFNPHAPANDTQGHDPDGDTPRRDTLERLDCTLSIAPNGQIPVENLLQATREAFAAAIASSSDPASAEPDPTLVPPREPSARQPPARKTRPPHQPAMANTLKRAPPKAPPP